MEVAVMSPQDPLKRAHTHHHQYTHHQKRMISPNKPNRNPNSSNPTTRSNRRRRNSPPPSGPTKPVSRSPSPDPEKPVMGQVRILKRGEDLKKPSVEAAKPMQKPRPVGGPGPMLAQMIDGFYAGSACVTSPPPSELPLPAFFTRSCRMSALDDVNNNQRIASDLRRVLKLC